MSVEQSDSYQMILLALVSSVGHLDMASVEMPMPVKQLLVISHVPTLAATNISTNVTYL